MSEEIESLISLLSIPSDIKSLSTSLPQKFSEVNEQLKSVSQQIQSISGPVRDLEVQRSNAKKALLYVTDIINFHSKLRELVSAFKFDNLPLAALLCGEISNIPIRYNSPESQEFQRVKSEVCEKVKKTFGEALSDNNKQVVEQYAGLFHHLQLGREGINSYINYILDSLRSNFDSMSETQSTEESLLTIYRQTVKQYDTQYENITKEFGISGTLDLLQQLQHLSDKYAVEVISRHLKQLNLKTKSQVICEEITKIIKHSESFENYLRKLGKKLVENGAKVEDEGKSKENGLVNVSSLMMKIFELADLYISFESQLLQEGVAGFLDKFTIGQMAEVMCQEKKMLNTGILFERLDDCFFLVQNACARVMSTFNINSICAILNNVAILISEKILGTLSGKIQYIKCAWSSNFTVNNTTTIILLNLLGTSKKCVKKIVNSLEQQFSKIFGNSNMELSMFQNCVINISDSETQAKKFIDQLVLNIVKMFNYKDLLSSFRNLSYELSLDEHSDYEVNDPFALKLIKDLKVSLKQWSFQLNHELFEGLVDGLIDELVKSIEKEIKVKKFNELGALQFQKDVREILAQAQNFTNKPLRHRFVRLKQISELLLAMDTKEVESLIQDTEWKLSKKESLGFRSLRI